ncbi:MAG: ACP S-malonyltransferase [Thiolinea sp.]
MLIAGLFPGQGSQSSGMLAELAASYSVVSDVFQQASDILGRDLWAIARSGTEDELNHTENTQPLMLAAGVACLRVWLQQGGRAPSAFAGHSLGEYSALVAGGVLNFADAMRIVAERSQLMQSAVPAGEGAMAAILGLKDEQVMQACEQAAQGEVVAAVNFNTPGQVVIGGHAAAVERAIAAATELGAKKAVPLAMSVPSHCMLLKPVAEKLSDTLQGTTFSEAVAPVLHNVDGQSRATPAAMRDAVSQQLYQPVRWVDTIRSLQQDHGIEAMLEFGPGKVLTGLNRRIERRMKAACVFDNKSLDAALKLCEESC